MKHIIGKYQSTDLSFSDIIETETSNSFNVVIDLRSEWKGSKGETYDHVRMHLNREQLIKLVADLTTYINIEE